MMNLSGGRANSTYNLSLGVDSVEHNCQWLSKYTLRDMSQAKSQKSGILGILDTEEHLSKWKDWGTFCENQKEFVAFHVK